LPTTFQLYIFSSAGFLLWPSIAIHIACSKTSTATNAACCSAATAVDQYNHKSNGLDVKITVPAPSGGQTTSCQGHIGSDVTVTVQANSASGHAEVRDISNNALVCTCK